MVYVYILECADGSYYTGWTDEITKRLEVHQNGKGAKYTRSRLPVKLVLIEELENKSFALKREAAIKKLTKKEKEVLVKASQGGVT